MLVETSTSCDNYFTDLPIAKKLAENYTTAVGTLRSNKRCLPNIANDLLTQRARGDAKHYYTDFATICSFWDKGKRTIKFLCTMHGRQRNIDAEYGKPEINQCYNETKSGVDTLENW